MKVKYFNFVIFSYFIIAFLFLFYVGFDALDGLNNIQFFADSTTYEKIYFEETYKQLGLFSVSSNYLGPVIILELTNGNRWLVFVFNCILLYISFFILKNLKFINYKKFFFILLLNPLTFQSLLSVNKEIISILVAVLFFLWVTKRSYRYLIFALILSVLVRWQLTVLLIALVPPILFFNSSYQKRVLISILFILSLSIFFKIFSGFFSDVVNNFLDSAHLHDGGGVFVILNQLQLEGYFFIVWLLKFFQISFALSFNIFNIANFSNFQNDVVLVLASISYLSIFLYALKLKILNFNNKYFLILLFSASFMSLTVIFSPRYFLFVFVFLILMVSIKRGSRLG